jgi:hypothetical protein
MYFGLSIFKSLYRDNYNYNFMKVCINFISQYMKFFYIKHTLF